MNEPNRKAVTAGTAVALAVVTGIWLGSRALTRFYPALIWYATGSVLSAFAVACRFAVWTQRPPSRLYFKRGLQLVFRHCWKAAPSGSSRQSRFNAARFPPFNPSATPSAGVTLGRAVATQFASGRSALSRRLPCLPPARAGAESGAFAGTLIQRA
jgi:hypothetical protein